MADAVLIVDGVEFPARYNGYTVSRNKIWSTNTGRNAAGEMVGTIIAIKDKIELEMIPMSPERAAILDSKASDIDNPFVTVRFFTIGGVYKEITAYWGDITFPFLGTKVGASGLIDGIKVSVIEK